MKKKPLLLIAVAGILLFFYAGFRLVTNELCIMRIENGKCVTFERANTEAERQLGLSTRSSLTKDRGMLFVFDAVDRQCMWMKDMFFDLDMIWLDANGSITQIATDIGPETYPYSYCGEGKYVVEVNAGVAKQAGLKVGDHLNLP